MDDHDLAAKLLQDHFTATAALIALMLKNDAPNLAEPTEH
jgi:hypothetical protein